ncbi:ribonuclease H family protein [Alicyclobacillus macrosporangiidus]|uniref:ribonuclease H family protein n=1 Tax=Alicyclobacillus macrosporangiidus TaxID=392015 RepID=UPI0004950F44|nr:ribonuclease H family protein [Alicyclobacillus macrosporangiidus]
MRVFTDASYDEKAKIARLGVFAMDGLRTERTGLLLQQTPDSTLAELLAVLTAIHVANDQQWKVESICLDSQSVVGLIQRNELSSLCARLPNSIRMDVQLLPVIHRLVPIEHVPRHQNVAAHALSREPVVQAAVFSEYLNSLSAGQPCLRFLLQQGELPKDKPTQASVFLQPTAFGFFLAHETYAVDAIHRRCTCPEFAASGKCAHVEAAVRAMKDAMVEDERRAVH